MLATVRARILFFALLSLAAVASLAMMSWVIILKAENTADNLIRHNLQESWILVDLEQDHRRLQDLAFKIKAQLLLWDEIEAEYQYLDKALTSDALREESASMRQLIAGFRTRED